MNPFGIREPCIKMANNELIFEQYIMTLNRDKYYIDNWNDDAIKRNQIFFDFMQQTFNLLDGFYLRERCILMDAIIEDLMRKRSATEIEKLNREKIPERKERKVNLSLLP